MKHEIEDCIRPHCEGIVNMHPKSKHSSSFKKSAFIPLKLAVFNGFPGITTHCGCIFHSPLAGFSLLVFKVS
jgi:hypothetical protein